MSLLLWGREQNTTHKAQILKYRTQITSFRIKESMNGGKLELTEDESKEIMQSCGYKRSGYEHEIYL